MTTTRVTLISGVVVAICWLLAPGLVLAIAGRSGAAEIGDAFGVSNSLLSGAALIGVCATIYVQILHQKRQDNFVARQIELSTDQLKTAARQMEIENQRFLLIEARETLLELYPSLRSAPRSVVKLKEFSASLGVQEKGGSLSSAQAEAIRVEVELIIRLTLSIRALNHSPASVSPTGLTSMSGVQQL